METSIILAQTGPQQLQQAPRSQRQTLIEGLLHQAVSVALGLLVLLFGAIIAFYSLVFTCRAAGVVLISSSVLVMASELSTCFSSYAWMRPLISFCESRPYYQKVTVYLGPALIAIVLCFSLVTFLGSLCLIGVVAVNYRMTITKKETASNVVSI